MRRRAVALLAALGLLVACTNSKAAPPPTTRPPLRPDGTTTVAQSTASTAPTAPSPSIAPSFVAVPYGTGCPSVPIPFQVIGVVSSWTTFGALWSGIDPVSGNNGIVEVYNGLDLPDPADPTRLTVLGSPATIGTISDGFVVRFTIGSLADLCSQWALVAHPQTTMATLRELAERLTFFGAGEQTLDCAAALHDNGPTNIGDETLMNLVDLPVDRALQTSRDVTSVTGISVLFAKNGLVIHPGVAFDLVVASELRGLVAMSWDRRAEPVSVVHVPACASADPTARLVFIGGFYALHTMCAIVQIVQFDVVAPVQLGIGEPCPNQPPVEGPTET